MSDATRRDARGPARLELSGVVVDFGGVRAVAGADLVAEPGDVVGLIGPNGSGKTTMLDVVSGLVTPTEGAVRLDDESLVEYLPEERASLGIVRSFQDCRLFPELTVEEVLLLTLDAVRPVGIVSTSVQAPWARRSERAKREAVGEVIRLVRHRPVPAAPDHPAVHRHATGGGPRLHRAGPTPAAPARRAHRRHRPTGGRGVRPAAPAPATSWPTPPSCWSSTTCRWCSPCAPRW